MTPTSIESPSIEMPAVPLPHPHDVFYTNRQYKLDYRHGNNMNWKTFFFDGSFRQAMDRARDHCTRMGYRFLFLAPFVRNLDDDEKARENGLNF
jgi:hypothetical protein